MRIHNSDEVKEHDEIHNKLVDINPPMKGINDTFEPEETSESQSKKKKAKVMKDKEVITNFRLQCRVTKKLERIKPLRQMINATKEKAKIILPSCSDTEKLILRSLPGGGNQDQHNDYTPSYVMKCIKDKKRAMSAIALIKHEMKLMIGNLEVRVHPGEVIFFDMDTTHGGCGYDVNCYRLFMKFGYHKISKKNKEDNSVGYIKTCLYCYYPCDPSNMQTFYSHVRFCEDNPEGKSNRERRGIVRKKKK